MKKKAQNVMRSIKRGYAPMAPKPGAPSKTVLKKIARIKRKP